MIAPNEKILVSCNIEQKEFMQIGDQKFQMATLFEKNYREKSPVLAVAMQNKGEIVKGDILVIHHNTFYEPSPYFVTGDIYSIPYTKTIFGKILPDGQMIPLCTNMICKRVPIASFLEIPPEHQKYYIDRAIVISSANGVSYSSGNLIFHKPNASYEIVYIYNNVECRVIKISEDQVVGFLK